MKTLSESVAKFRLVIAEAEGLSKSRPYERWGITWTVKRGERPVTRRRGRVRGARNRAGVAVEKVWIVYADGKEVLHDHEGLKGLASWISALGGFAGKPNSEQQIAAKIAGLVKQREADHDTWTGIYGRNFA